MKEILKLNKGIYSGNVQELKEHAGFITSKTVYEGDYHADFHYHENPHLSFILQGGNFEYKNGKASVRNAGEVLFYRSGELHKTLPTIAKTKNLNLEIDTDFLKNNLLSEPDLYDVICNRQDSRLFMLKIHAEIHFNDSLTEISIHAALLSYIKAFKPQDLSTAKWGIQLKEILNEEWNQNHSLSELSGILGVHPVTISKYFAKNFGCTFGEYVRKLRIQKSLELIKCTNYSLTEIAYLCGFADQSHFLRVFKFYTGMNPKYFQKL